MQFEKEAYAINIDLKRGRWSLQDERGLVGFPLKSFDRSGRVYVQVGHTKLQNAK